MNRHTFLSILVVALIVLNLILLFSFFGMPGSRKPMHKNPKEVIIKRLNFDKEQIKTYENLIEEHHAQMKPPNDSIKLLKNTLHRLLLQPNDSSKVSIIQKINSLQNEIEYIRYNHFKDIKQLCNKNQLKAFEMVVEDIAKIFGPPPPPPHKPKK